MDLENSKKGSIEWKRLRTPGLNRYQIDKMNDFITDAKQWNSIFHGSLLYCRFSQIDNEMVFKQNTPFLHRSLAVEVVYYVVFMISENEMPKMFA